MRLPPELPNDGNADILKYLRLVEKDGVKMPIAKIILTGPPWAGKTCLVHRLVHKSFQRKRQMTPGVSLKSWKVPDADDLEFLFYDLGGQPVYATTHRLFLHTRACFLV
eukprot:scaffold6366_cov143-Pinguiococcus_pyrenoidosus.AAC.1